MRTEILWVALSADGGRTDVEGLRKRFEVQTVHNLGDVAVMVQRWRPSVICFDFHAPSSLELFALRECKRLFPSIPILMLTEAHSELLAVWALRARVWDYLVKPFSTHRLDALIGEVLDMMRTRPQAAPRRPRFPNDKGNERCLAPAAGGARRAVEEAKLYVHAHLGDKIVASEVAERCGLSQFHFSRLFKRETGMTFNEYVTEARVAKAMGALQLPGARISQVAAEAGFLDLSYFAKVFRRHAHLSPREFVELHRSQAGVRADRRHAAGPGADEDRPALHLYP